jgi:hypothetical protein
MPYDFVVVITNVRRFCGHFEFLKLKVLYMKLEICRQHLAQIKKKADTVNATPEGRVNSYKINIL